MISASSYTPEEPISAIATPLAPGALGIVRTSGKNVIELVAKVFSRPKALKEAKGNTLVYGWIQDLSGNKIDEVMLGVYRSPKSFTGEEMVSIMEECEPVNRRVLEETAEAAKVYVKDKISNNSYNDMDKDLPF